MIEGNCFSIWLQPELSRDAKSLSLFALRRLEAAVLSPVGEMEN